MLSTDTIFVLRDRFDGREGRTDADGQSASERSPANHRKPARESAPDFGQDLRLVRTPESAHRARTRPLMTAVPSGAGQEHRHSELGAMKGILLGVAIGATCWAFVGGVIYSFLG